MSINDLNIRKGPGTNYGKTGYYTGKGVFTIVAESAGAGSVKGWGKLKSGARLDCTRLRSAYLTLMGFPEKESLFTYNAIVSFARL